MITKNPQAPVKKFLTVLILVIGLLMAYNLFK